MLSNCRTIPISLLIFFLSHLAVLSCKPSSDIIPKELKEAQSQSKSQNKKLILIFGADWCPDCRALDSIFSDAEVRRVLDSNFILHKIDVGRFDKNLEISDSFGSPIENGIPALVVLEPNGRVLTSTKGGEFSSASKMTKEQVLEYLYKL